MIRLLLYVCGALALLFSLRVNLAAAATPPSACPYGEDLAAVERRLTPLQLTRGETYVSHDGDLLTFYVDARDATGRWLVVQTLASGCAHVVDLGDYRVAPRGGYR